MQFFEFSNILLIKGNINLPVIYWFNIELEDKMNNYITGKTIKALREKNRLTQRELAEKLLVSDKTISKWENGRGYPDIEILAQLASTLSVEINELVTGDVIENKNRNANMKKMQFYVCPVCNNAIYSIGEANISCCGIKLPVLEVEDCEEGHIIDVERVENEYYVHINHSMCKEHYIHFIAYVTNDGFEARKMYPEQNAETRFLIKGRGYIYIYCNIHGLFRKNI